MMVLILPSEKVLPARLNVEIIATLQEKIAPQVFTPRAVYDGRKNLFAAHTLPFGQMAEFEVTLGDTKHVSAPAALTVPRAGSGPGKGPKVYKVRLNKVAEINPETLSRFLQGQQSNDNSVLTAITALNVVIRMEPTIKYPFNVRSFFTNAEKKVIGGGLEVWRGYFQSARPALGRMLINIDISTAVMFRPGPLINVCLDFFGGNQDPRRLSFKFGLPDRERLRLQRFLAGVRVLTDPTGKGNPQPRVIRKLSDRSATDTRFSLREGGNITVANYFKQTYNITLKHPDAFCIETGNGAVIPIELCIIPEGQFMRRQVPPEKTKDVLEFATMKPADRLDSIKRGLQVLSYGQSEYVRQFGLAVNTDSTGPIEIAGRILPPPTLKYGAGSRQQNITPRDGAWNMKDTKFYQPCEVKGWTVVIFERQQRFNESACKDMIIGLKNATREVGIEGMQSEPLIRYANGQGDVGGALLEAGKAYHAARGAFPALIIVVLPEGATDIYTGVKHFGDIVAGVATQCLKSSKCYRAKPQYYANVCLKINVKLGGINTIPDPRSVPFLTDQANPTLVLGADVIHPAPGSAGRPSFTSLVGNVDSDTSKYIAITKVQTSRQEMIEDLEDMAAHVLGKYIGYRKVKERKPSAFPKRIIFYRDGVSEGQFKTVLETEVPRIKAACRRHNINPLPKITVIVVGKRHHVRFFPISQDKGDRSGNCPAGTVIDRDVTHPLEFDFYLQSHGGLLGTSRPAHYNVLLDENSFQPDGLQQLSFALCHVYARSTRSVSIPAPVYYADIVCARAKNHYDPKASLEFSDSVSQVSGPQATTSLEAFRKQFKPLHANTQLAMYFS
ncbi:argonaute-like protein [Cantharellus anzutake]|uniref:argonaute-like protein n=1 Tax=Cantharellus anzutake TaxID=1750568 RepID=UPI0019038902|nr:argonaute-like protein [Cantharellus anzutake]KAF8335043.1 argonaute-like protein [Cantharellus anzutake]